jgi:hypothetical protein
VDAGGNVVVTGYSQNSTLDYNCATVKYSSAGAALWTNFYNGPENGDDYAMAVAVDLTGNVYVTGYSLDTGTSYDYVTLKYSAAGAPLWTNFYNGPANGKDYAQAVAVGAGGDVYVTGSSAVSGSTNDYATVAYSSAGVPLWTNRYNGPANGDDAARAVAVDAAGIVYVTGYSAGTTSGYDYATIAYSSAGVPLWTNRYNGPANGHDRPQTKSSLAIGPGGAVYVTGASDGNFGSATTYGFATVTYVSVPAFTNTTLIGAGLILAGSDGSPGATYYVLASTNLADRLNWRRIATNTFGPDGSFSLTNTLDPKRPVQFFRLEVP